MTDDAATTHDGASGAAGTDGVAQDGSPSPAPPTERAWAVQDSTAERSAQLDAGAPALAAPGWYPVTANSDLRFWNGTAWSNLATGGVPEPATFGQKYRRRHPIVLLMLLGLNTVAGPGCWSQASSPLRSWPWASPTPPPSML